MATAPAPGVYRPDQVPARRGDWMQTYTGRQYWPLDPRPSEVHPPDIGHHLSMLCRYCGACRRFYSVLEHSLGVLHVGTRALGRSGGNLAGARVLARRIRAHLLVHDAPEAYCHDLIRPIKRSVDGYDVIEAANYDAIVVRLDIGNPSPTVEQFIKQADNAMLLAEQDLLMAPPPAVWAPVDVDPQMRADALAWLRASRWKRWRRWRWWQKREFAKTLETLTK